MIDPTEKDVLVAIGYKWVTKEQIESRLRERLCSREDSLNDACVLVQLLAHESWGEIESVEKLTTGVRYYRRTGQSIYLESVPLPLEEQSR